MANLHAVRIHELAGDIRSRVIALCKGVSGSYVVVRETEASRVHYQAWFRTDLSQPTFRARLKAAFPECVGNKGYSLTKVRDQEAYERYLMKGTREEMPDVVCYCGLQVDSDYISGHHRAYWSRAEKPGKSNRSLVEEVHEWYVERSQFTDVSRRDIASRICETLAARKKSISVFHVRGMTNTVQWLSSSPGAREIILDEICNKY